MRHCNVEDGCSTCSAKRRDEVYTPCLGNHLGQKANDHIGSFTSYYTQQTKEYNGLFCLVVALKKTVMSYEKNCYGL
jgi:hypothetical protein